MLRIGAIALGLIICGGANAQPEPVLAAPRIDPAAMAALDRMGAYLRTLDRFAVTGDVTTEEVFANGQKLTEEVFANGQKLQFLNRVEYLVDAPENMVVEVRSDRIWRRYYYDGSAVTIAAPRYRYYTRFAVSGPILDVLDAAYERYGIEFPLQDLFIWGSDYAHAAGITDAVHVGYAQLGEYATDHYAFRQPGVDFQIWLDQGDAPLPRKLVIANTDDPAQPEYVAMFQWDLSPEIDDDAFIFDAPEGWSLIDLRPAPQDVAEVQP